MHWSKKMTLDNNLNINKESQKWKKKKVNITNSINTLSSPFFQISLKTKK